MKSPHRHVAVCNDCHAPHDLVGKYAVKANNGFWHSFAFTSGDYPDPVRIKPGNREVTEGACRRCHAPIVEAIDANHSGKNAVACLSLPRQRRSHQGDVMSEKTAPASPGHPTHRTSSSSSPSSPRSPRSAPPRCW